MFKVVSAAQMTTDKGGRGVLAPRSSWRNLGPVGAIVQAQIGGINGNVLLS